LRSSNQNNNITPTWLRQKIQSLSASSICLDLTRQFSENLSKNTIKQIVKTFKEIPDYIISINLSLNSLYTMDPSDLKLIFAALPRNLKVLNLSSNYLGRIKYIKMKKVFAELPSSLISIDLDSNHLQHWRREDIIDFIKSMPNELFELKVSTNYLIHHSLNNGLDKITYHLPLFLRSIGSIPNNYDIELINSFERTRQQKLDEINKCSFFPKVLTKKILAYADPYNDEVESKKCYNCPK